MAYQKDEDGVDIYHIPQNIFESKRILGYRRKSWIEGAAWTCLTTFIICQIDFVIRVKLIFIICIGISVIIINLAGYKNQTFSELFLNYLKYKSEKSELHLRSIKYEKKTVNKLNEKGEFVTTLNESYLDTIIRVIKEKYTLIKEEGIENIFKK